jgi:hypothetical protein
MKKVVKLFVIFGLVIPAILTISNVVLADTNVYDNDQTGWEAAVGSWITEDFEDGIVGPGVSVVSDNGSIYTQLSGNDLWYDWLYYDEGPTSTTTWTFDVPIHAFGGMWDLGSQGGDPDCGSPGSNIEVLINGSWVSIGVIDREKIDEFWGFVSDVPFTQIRLQGYSDEGWVERYTLDDMVYSVLPQYLTGGGQIVTDTEGVKKKDQYKVSFAGNLGYAGNHTLMGQYQLHLHNVSVDSLDGAVFHSTSVEILNFYRDDNGGPNPPPAEANVAYFKIDGRLKMKSTDEFVDGYTMYAYVADRGEPGMNDSINFALWEGATVLYSSTYDFPHTSQVETPGVTLTTPLTAGNLQIHADYIEMME